ATATLGNDSFNDTATWTSQVLQPADLSVNVTAPATVNAGATIVYMLTATNNGPGDASNVTLSNILPAQITSAFTIVKVSGPAAVISKGNSGSNQTATITLASLPAGASATFTITASAPTNL